MSEGGSMEEFKINIPFKKEAHLQNARERYPTVEEELPTFDKAVDLMLSPSIMFENALSDVKTKYTIDKATGVNLDVIGSIVGQPREVVDSDLLKYFIFEGVPVGGGFGDLNDNLKGEPFWDMNNPLYGNILLSDDQYRVFIKAKIFKNNSIGSVFDLVEFMEFVFNNSKVYFLWEETAKMIVLLGGNLNNFERTLLKYWTQAENYERYFIPKPVGVKLEIGDAQLNNAFGFVGAIEGVMGFGDLQCVDSVCIGVDGGVFASLNV